MPVCYSLNLYYYKYRWVSNSIILFIDITHIAHITQRPQRRHSQISKSGRKSG